LHVSTKDIFPFDYASFVDTYKSDTKRKNVSFKRSIFFVDQDKRDLSHNIRSANKCRLDDCDQENNKEEDKQICANKIKKGDILNHHKSNE